MEPKHAKRDLWYCFLWLQAMFLGHVISQGTDTATEPELRYACWDSFGPPVVSAQCPRNTVIQVKRAGLKVQTRGGHCAFEEQDCGCEFEDEECNMPNVRDICMGRPACRLDVTQQYINSPTCQGFSDYMFIQFNCVQARRGSDLDICSTAATSYEQGFLHSPSYPHVYPPNRQCECSLSTSSQSSVVLSLLDFYADDTNCEHSTLLLSHDGVQKKVCTGGGDQVLVEGSTEISLTFDTDDQSGKGGFWMKYEALPASSVKIKCRSLYKPAPRANEPPEGAGTVKSTLLPESTEQTTVTPEGEGTVIPPQPASRSPLLRRRRPDAPTTTTESASSTETMTTATPGPMTPKPISRQRGKPISRGGGGGGGPKGLNSEERPRGPKPTPWWWKYTQRPTQDAPHEITNEDLIEVLVEEELGDQTDTRLPRTDFSAVDYVVEDDRRAEEVEEPAADNSDNNEIDTRYQQPVPESEVSPLGPIPSNRLHPVLPDTPSPVVVDAVDHYPVPANNALVPPKQNTKAGKFFPPFSVKIWLKNFNLKNKPTPATKTPVPAVPTQISQLLESNQRRPLYSRSEYLQTRKHSIAPKRQPIPHAPEDPPTNLNPVLHEYAYPPRPRIPDAARTETKHAKGISQHNLPKPAQENVKPTIGQYASNWERSSERYQAKQKKQHAQKKQYAQVDVKIDLDFTDKKDVKVEDLEVGFGWPQKKSTQRGEQNWKQQKQNIPNEDKEAEQQGRWNLESPTRNAEATAQKSNMPNQGWERQKVARWPKSNISNRNGADSAARNPHFPNQATERHNHAEFPGTKSSSKNAASTSHVMNDPNKGRETQHLSTWPEQKIPNKDGGDTKNDKVDIPNDGMGRGMTRWPKLTRKNLDASAPKHNIPGTGPEIAGKRTYSTAEKLMILKNEMKHNPARWKSKHAPTGNIPEKAARGNKVSTNKKSHNSAAKEDYPHAHRPDANRHKSTNFPKDILSVFRVDYNTYLTPDPQQIREVKPPRQHWEDTAQWGSVAGRSPSLSHKSAAAQNLQNPPKSENLPQGHSVQQKSGSASSFITGAMNESQTPGDVVSNTTGTAADQRSGPENQAFYGEGNSLTVTIVAACVIGGILLIIVVGILVRFMINKADPQHQMRQMHKKECVLRRNAKILNKGAKGKSFA